MRNIKNYIHYYSKVMANIKVSADKQMDKQMDRQTEGPKTTCPRSIDVGA